MLLGKTLARALLNSTVATMYSKTYYYSSSSAASVYNYVSNVDENGATITVNLPGVNKDNVTISYSDVDYTVKIEAQKNKAKVFSQSFDVCDTKLDMENAKATMQDGQLLFKIPNKKPPQLKTIKIT